MKERGLTLSEAAEINNMRESTTGEVLLEKTKSVDPPFLQKTTKDFKHLIESSKIIDQIFHQRTLKVQAEKKAEEEKKAKEEAELKEVLDANKSLKDSMHGRTSQGVLSDNSSPNRKPVDTTKEFINTINDQLHTTGAGIQIIMQESKDA